MSDLSPYLAATPILDHGHPRVLALTAEARAAGASGRGLLIAAHRLIAARVRPVYALDDEQPTSRTLLRARGSCSQRLAVLEAVSRACGIPTRVRGLLVDGRFWHARADLGRFVARDVLFREHGQTVCRPVRVAVDPVMSRYAASAGKAN
ncbi:hypothetical protein ACWCOT_33260 [Nonomuraea bangladeshensis]